MIVETAKLLIEGQNIEDIKEYLKERGKNKTEAMKIIEKAFNQLLENTDISKYMRLAWCLEALRDIYKRLMESGDYNGATRAIKEIVSLSDFKKEKNKNIDNKEIESLLSKQRLNIVSK